MNVNSASTVGKSTVSESHSAFSKIESYKALKASYLFYFLSNQSSLIIREIWPFLGSTAAEIVIMAVSNGVQGLKALEEQS